MNSYFQEYETIKEISQVYKDSVFTNYRVNPSNPEDYIQCLELITNFEPLFIDREILSNSNLYNDYYENTLQKYIRDHTLYFSNKLRGFDFQYMPVDIFYAISNSNRNPIIPEHLISKYSSYWYGTIREYVANYPHTPIHILESMRNDRSAYVRMVASESIERRLRLT